MHDAGCKNYMASVQKRKGIIYICSHVGDKTPRFPRFSSSRRRIALPSLHGTTFAVCPAHLMNMEGRCYLRRHIGDDHGRCAGQAMVQPVQLESQGCALVSVVFPADISLRVWHGERCFFTVSQI
jgi:hypothetical protein